MSGTHIEPMEIPERFRRLPYMNASGWKHELMDFMKQKATS